MAAPEGQCTRLCLTPPPCCAASGDNAPASLAPDFSILLCLWLTYALQILSRISYLASLPTSAGASYHLPQLGFRWSVPVRIPLAGAHPHQGSSALPWRKGSLEGTKETIHLSSLAEVWEKADLRLAWESRVGELGTGRAA